MYGNNDMFLSFIRVFKLQMQFRLLSSLILRSERMSERINETVIRNRNEDVA